MDDRQPIHPYQRSFLHTLTPASSRHFGHTRRLTLGLYTLDNAVKLDAIHHRLIELLSIYQFASPWLKHLELGVGPFIESEFDFDSDWGDWALAEACNQIINFIVSHIALRETKFEEGLAVGIVLMGAGEDRRPHINTILSLLGPKITALGLRETIPYIVEHLPTMTALRSFRFESFDEEDEAEAEMLWRAISQLSSVLDNSFSRVGCPPKSNTFASHVTKLALNDIDDIYFRLRHLLHANATTPSLRIRKWRCQGRRCRS